MVAMKVLCLAVERVDSLAFGSADKKVGKMDVDSSPMTAQKYNIMSIPSLIIFKNGEVFETMIGMQTKDTLLEKLAAAAK